MCFVMELTSTFLAIRLPTVPIPQVMWSMSMNRSLLFYQELWGYTDSWLTLVDTIELE